MSHELFQEHLQFPSHRGPVPDAAFVGTAGGAACGDLVRFALVLDEDGIAQVSFDAEGCGATLAAGSACASLVDGRSALEAAAIGSDAVVDELGGLVPSKLHAAELACDALHRALSIYWGAQLARQTKRAPDHRRSLIAMSGGVDSAAAALLSVRSGRETIGVTLKLWSDVRSGHKSCCSAQAVVDARSLAHSLGIPHITLDIEDEFRANVVDDYVREHEAGRTPNPCVRCNGRVRFDAMVALADALGAATLETGHYARIEDDDQGPLLAPARDQGKDQTYMLAALRPELLGRLRFPLAGLEKPQVRELAREAGLSVADRPESQDLCFLAGTTRKQFLARHGRAADLPGDLVNAEGRLLGRHRGHAHYTVGQRRGLGVASGQPLYVLGKDPRRNRVIVGPREQLAVDNVALEPGTLLRDPGRVVAAKLRYRSEPVACAVEGADRPGRHDRLELRLAEPFLGAASGQVASLFDADGRVVGHGVIAGAASPALAGTGVH